MTVLVVVQARLSSTRLPGKALLSIGGLPMVVLVAHRAATTGLRVVVATSCEPDDDPIAVAVAAHGYACVRGSLVDPLDRFVTAAASLEDNDVVVRLTADNVVPDGGFVTSLLDCMISGGTEYARMAGGLPYGLSAECFSVRLLREAAATAVGAFDREHVTPWMRRTAEESSYRPDDIPRSWSSIHCTVDTLHDYRIAAGVLGAEGDPVSVGWRTLLERWAVAAPGRDVMVPRRETAIGQGPLVLGTVQLGLPYGATNWNGLPDEPGASEVIAAAAAAGVTHVDTARAYGLSEERIGDAVRRGASQGLGVITKIAPLDQVPSDAAPGWARAAVEASIARSLCALRSSRVDALLLHRWHDWGKGDGAVGHCMADLRGAGIATLIGASVATTDELIQALTDPRVGYVQLPFNMLDRRWLNPDVVATLATRPDVVVAARSVFLQGLLASGGSVDWPAISSSAAAAITSSVEDLVHELKRSNPADLCVAYVMGHDFVTSVVIGAETPEQVRENADLVRRPPLDPTEIDLVHARLPAGPAELLDPSRWGSSHA